VARFIKGEIVVIPFPFSDLSGSKRRPAMVIADLERDDILLCQITSQNSSDKLAVALTSKGFVNGSLPVDSYIRPTRIFTADKNIVVRRAGLIKTSLIDEVTQTIINIIK
jgi:mRNA interferase MazF